MNRSKIRQYLCYYGKKYLSGDIFKHYPEVKIIAPYLRQHFSKSEIVLDIGFGTGLWFWASFLPKLKRLDGIDLYPEAFTEASRIFQLRELPQGYVLAHKFLGNAFTKEDLLELKNKRGKIVYMDYRKMLPKIITDTRYDLITEHGGGLGQMNSGNEVIEAVTNLEKLLKKSGFFFFANFVMKPKEIEKELGRAAENNFQLSEDIFYTSVRTGRMKMKDFHMIDDPTGMPDVEKFFYGFAEKE